MTGVLIKRRNSDAETHTQREDEVRTHGRKMVRWRGRDLASTRS